MEPESHSDVWEEHGLQKLSTFHMNKNARYDSREREQDPFCSEGTRADILSDIAKWADDKDSPTLFWLSGLAGTGKSTISRTVARDCDEQERLAASFCFSKENSSPSGVGLFAYTIAYQLADFDGYIESAFWKALRCHRLLPCQGLLQQWKKLVLEPLSCFPGRNNNSALIVIDGLDSCLKECDMRLIIRLLSEVPKACKKRVRVLLTSRPERAIRTELSGIHHRQFKLQDIQRGVVDGDIRLFISGELRNIAQNVEGMSTEWPGDETISKLVNSAEGLFLWAAAACQYLRDGRKKSAILSRLQHVLANRAKKGSPQEKLNQTYAAILGRFFKGYWNEDEISTHCNTVNHILAAMCVVQAPVSVTTLERLLPQEDISATVSDLQSILKVPDDTQSPIALLHSSIRRFLSSGQQSPVQRHEAQVEVSHMRMAFACLDLMTNWFERRQKTSASLPAEMWYACSSWIMHLQLSIVFRGVDGQVNRFLESHLFDWIEAVKSIGKTCLLDGLVADLVQMAPMFDQQARCQVYQAKERISALSSAIDTTSHATSSVMVAESDMVWETDQCNSVCPGTPGSEWSKATSGTETLTGPGY
ncbi:hypothetical protein BO78DRAFT_428627 [Aspergillus sclerotiicarbonarius CBS 121057]|uniref:Nephrocystin 3-like N-terminal domain-containing protein n=1 Tax=Aspergillus sclerotiicarbonarius (strain CBS 121057 / IBT 28362) TaxID=1448318 RepID=A0A319EJF5_ASPSB|nr:hypothetical protein BO78DRAFT_428627 [Aspergillus sclerotiicarbonarius CBS 121057]